MFGSIAIAAEQFLTAASYLANPLSSEQILKGRTAAGLTPIFDFLGGLDATSGDGICTWIFRAFALRRKVLVGGVYLEGDFSERDGPEGHRGLPGTPQVCP
jgi:hypothetical protein